MEIEEAWAPEVHITEVNQYGTVLDPKYMVKFDQSDVEKYHTLYYLKPRNVFVTVEYDTNQLQVLSDSTRIRSFREKYLGELSSNDISDAFSEADSRDYSSFKSEFNLHDIESIKKQGTFLEIDIEGVSYYYIEYLDTFVHMSDSQPPSLIQSSKLRKKYNIPFQDERFADIHVM